MTGAQILIESLKREGVEVMFGYPGGQVLPIFDKLYDSDLKLILVRHEQGAAHAADGYSRATGKVGVCLATSGPGATNLTTGIATAYMDSIPMVAITGQVKSFLIGNDAFQEADVTGITRPITKHNFLVKNVKDLARIVREAFYIASTGRPGPVLIDIPSDVQGADTEFIWPERVEMRSYKPTYYGHPGQIKKAAKLIAAAKKPLLYIGGGVITSGAHLILREFAEKGGLADTLPVEVQVFRIGGLYIIALGGEISCEIGLELKEKLSDLEVCTLGYSNLLRSYVASLGAHSEGGYEVETAFLYSLTPEPRPLGYTPESVAVLINKGIELARSL